MSESSPRSLRADAQRNRARVIEAARAVVLDQGTEASLRDIARRAHVGLGTLYRHFPTRHDLLVALLHDLFRRGAALAEELTSSDAPAQALPSWLREYLRMAAPYRGFSATMLDTINDPKSALFAACSTMRGAVRALLRQAQDANLVRQDADELDVFVLLNAVSWVGEQAAFIAERQGRLFEFMLDGLSPRSGPRTLSAPRRSGAPPEGAARAPRRDTGRPARRGGAARSAAPGRADAGLRRRARSR